MEQGKIYSNFVRFLPLGLFLGVSLAGLALEPEVFLFSELAVLEAGFFTAGFLDFGINGSKFLLTNMNSTHQSFQCFFIRHS